jgi:hypothetical protein
MPVAPARNRRLLDSKLPGDMLAARRGVTGALCRSSNSFRCDAQFVRLDADTELLEKI